MKVNIYDIAKEAGVSIATVSRVINGKEGASDTTRRKVQKVLEKYHYTPNVSARGLNGKKIRSVAILTVDIRVSHYARTAYTIEREFSRRGYEVILCNTGGDIDATIMYLKRMIEKQVDGIIMVGSVFNAIGKDPKAEALLRYTPVVVANGKLDLPNSYSVLVDDRQGIAMMVEYLYEKKYRNLFYVRSKDTDSAFRKLDGFVTAAKLLGIEDKNHILVTDYSIEGGVEAAENVLMRNEQCDAIVCDEDLVASGVLKKLHREGIKIPEQIAVTGFNNSIISKIVEPELTGIDNKAEQVGLMSVQLLDCLINNDDQYSSVTILPEIIPGQTA